MHLKFRLSITNPTSIEKYLGSTEVKIPYALNVWLKQYQDHLEFFQKEYLVLRHGLNSCLLWKFKVQAW